MNTTKLRFKTASMRMILFSAGITLSAAACAPAPEIPEFMFDGLDYAFEGPDTLPAGPVLIGFENVGEVRHELVLVRLTEGVTLDSLLVSVQNDPANYFQLVDALGGVLVAAPGQNSWGKLYVELEQGKTYVLVCNFVDGEDQPQHHELGMFDSFVVI